MTTPQPHKTLSPWLILGIGALVIALLVGGVYAINRPASRMSHGPMHLPEGIQQPVWMDTAPASLKELYAFAYAHQEELQYIPCWCGCAPGHVDNYTCYWKKDEKGALTYEEHAYGWQICQETTRVVMKELQKGTPLWKIREKIDNEYKDDGLTSTDTPLPPKK